LALQLLQVRSNARPTRIKWADIKDLRFENQKKDDGSSITIVTNQEAKTIEITVLDEKVEALYKLINSFK